VPVGLTKYRENLFPVEPFNTKMAEELIDSIEKIQGKLFQNINTRFVFLSDEFYAMTDRSLPSYEEYEKFPQYENGVGLMRLFSHEIENELKNIRENISLNRNYIIPTGTLAYKFMLSITEKVSSKFDGLNLRVVPIINNFFGRTITVSGLITGQDLIEQLKEYKNIDGIIIPKCMLRKGEEIFLDDITVEDLKDKLKTNVILSDVSGDSFIKIFKKDLR
jgi:NifB/MoaA-like Fe-S oxidoreductase